MKHTENRKPFKIPTWTYSVAIGLFASAVGVAAIVWDGAQGSSRLASRAPSISVVQKESGPAPKEHPKVTQKNPPRRERQAELRKAQRSEAIDKLDSQPTFAAKPNTGARLPGIIESMKESEPRDHVWASDKETSIRQKILEGTPNAVVKDVVCGSTRCSATVDVSDRDAAEQIPGWFGDGRVAFEAIPSEAGYSMVALFARPGYLLDGAARQASATH